MKYQLRPSLCIIVNVGDHHFTYYSNEWKSNVPLQLQWNELQNVQHENKDLEVDSHINLYTADFASHFIHRK